MQRLSDENRGNLVRGRREPSRGAGRYELRAAREPWGSLGFWPRSDRDDLAPALAAAATGTREWAGTSRETRRRVLLTAAEELEARFDPAELAEITGLDQEEAATLRRDFAASLDDMDPPAGSGSGRGSASRGGIALCLPHWTELGVGVVRMVGAELFAGRAVILVPDARLPQLADRFADALLTAGLPPAAIAVVHGLDERVAFKALQGGIDAVRASGSRRKIRSLRLAAEAARVPRTHLSRLRNRATEIDPEDDFDLSARRVVDAAFGRSRTLFGQRAGQVGRVFCPERIHSRFTARLLEVLESDRVATDPLPLIDKAAVRTVRASWSGALDRGATMIFGGRSPADDVGHRASRRVLPTVFTNAEIAGGGELDDRPEPVLHLHRIPGK